MGILLVMFHGLLLHSNLASCSIMCEELHNPLAWERMSTDYIFYIVRIGP